MSVADTYPQPDAPDPVLSDEVVLDLTRHHHRSARAVTAVDESGGEARAYLIDQDVVLKTQRPHRLRPRTSLAKEAFILDQIAAQIDVAVPRVLGYGRQGSIEYLAMTRIPGRALNRTSLDQTTRAAVLEDLGRILRAIHGVDQTTLAGSDLIPGDHTPQDVRTRLAGTFDRLAADLGARDTHAGGLDVAGIAARCLDQIPADTTPVVLHSNPGPEHTFIKRHADTGASTGLIDFGDSYRSHPALDLRPFTDPTDALDLLAGYRAAGPLPNSFDPVWRTGLVIMQLTRVARSRRDPTQAATAIRDLLD